MTEQDKERLEVLRQERIARTEKMITTYEELFTYWSDKSRFIGNSSRLNQSAEFINQQIVNARETGLHLYRLLRVQ
jgi:hypothetical protein